MPYILIFDKSVYDIVKLTLYKKNRNIWINRNMPKTLSLTLLIVIFSLYTQTSTALKLDSLNHTKTQAETLQGILAKLNSRHYREQLVDDDLSQRFLDNYLDTLDPAHVFFYQTDINKFQSHADKFDDYFKKGNLSAGYEIYDVFRTRATSRLESVVEMLEDENIKFEFNTDDYVAIERDEEPWPSSLKEADELWIKRLKLSILNSKLSGKSVEEARESIAKRYKRQLKRIEQEDSADAFEILANSLTTLYDPHTNYWSPRTSENFNINMSLKLEGIGAVLQNEDEFTKVVRLVAGGPAHKQGQLKASDKILSVGQGTEGEMVDVVGWRLSEVVELIRGPKNTLVKLEVQTADQKHKNIVIKRDEVKLEDQAAEKAVLEVSDGKDIHKFGVIHLPTFYIDFDAYSRRDPNYKSSAKDVERLVNELKKEGVDGIILDLRNNGGGSLQEATNLTDLFIDTGPVVQIRSPDMPINRHNRSYRKAIYRGPLIVMVNRLSASASEIFAGAIQDYNRGLIVGSQTFGKGTVQSVRPLMEGRLKITESKFYRVSGDSTQHRGVIPDIEFPMLENREDVGESSYDNALPWDQIHKVPHTKYFDFSKIIPDLKKLHENRSQKDPDFEYINDQIGLMNENRNKNVVSLNEKVRKNEKLEIETRAMQIENKRRKAKGEKVYKTLEEFTEAEEVEKEEAETAQAEPQQKIDVDGDPHLIETGNILLDTIRLLNDSPEQQAYNI